jgi:hypothetical protein
MSNITIPSSLWFRLSDLIQDMGNHHPNFTGTEIGSDLDVLGNTIKCAGPSIISMRFVGAEQEWLDKATAVIAKHGGGRPKLSTVEQCIETAEKLLGIQY